MQVNFQIVRGLFINYVLNIHWERVFAKVWTELVNAMQQVQNYKYEKQLFTKGGTADQKHP